MQLKFYKSLRKIKTDYKLPVLVESLLPYIDIKNIARHREYQHFFLIILQKLLYKLTSVTTLSARNTKEKGGGSQIKYIYIFPRVL